MKAAVLREPNKPLSIEEVSISKPGPREVLVRLKAVGVCHSDVHFWDGAFPHELPTILGHESAGVVEQVGSMVSAVKPGDHVVSILAVLRDVRALPDGPHVGLPHGEPASLPARGR
jgi:S-(hydroxymethyl)glutathione dehydrogenase / alcohol dehydrogenase